MHMQAAMTATYHTFSMVPATQTSHQLPRALVRTTNYSVLCSKCTRLQASTSRQIILPLFFLRDDQHREPNG